MQIDVSDPAPIFDQPEVSRLVEVCVDHVRIVVLDEDVP